MMLFIGMVLIGSLGWLILSQVNRLVNLALFSAFILPYEQKLSSNINKEEMKKELDTFLDEINNSPFQNKVKRQYDLLAVLLLVLIMVAYITLVLWIG